MGKQIEESLSDCFGPIDYTFYFFIKMCAEKKVEPYFRIKIDSELHEFFKEVKEKYQRQIPELKKVIFSEKNIFPYSEELREILFSLENGGKLNWYESISGGCVYKFSKNLAKRIKEIPEVEKEIYKKIATCFFSDFACDENAKKRVIAL